MCCKFTSPIIVEYEYEDGTTIFDTISEGTFIIKRIGSFESED